MNWKVACLNAISEKGLSLLPKNFEVAEDKKQAEAWLVRSASLHEEEFPAGLRAVARAGAGVNNIPLDRCADEGIVVFNTPGANANAVRELVIAAMLLGSRDIVGGIEWVRANADKENVAALTEKEKKRFAGTEIRGKKLGVIGLGAIGYRVANIATSLGMEVYGYNPDIPIEYAWAVSRKVHHCDTLDEMISEVDFLTVHVPLNAGTKGMINEELLSKTKKGLILLNFARDILVDEEALRPFLESGHVRAYITDFPNPVSCNLPNTIVTPHIGASTEESEENCAEMAVKEVVDYLENGNIANSVNYPNVSLGQLHSPTRICVLHKNVPNAIANFTSLFGQAGLNIDTMLSASRGSYAYAIFDVASDIEREFAEKLNEHDSVLRVRVLKKN